MDPYTILQAQAAMTLNQIIQETNWTKSRPHTPRLARLRGAVGRRLIRVGTLLTQTSAAEPRTQTQSA